MQFAKDSYKVNEEERSLTAVIQRFGDISQSSTVRCYTRQATASVSIDYAERPNTNASIVNFEPGKDLDYEHLSFYCYFVVSFLFKFDSLISFVIIRSEC